MFSPKSRAGEAAAGPELSPLPSHTAAIADIRAAGGDDVLFRLFPPDTDVPKDQDQLIQDVQELRRLFASEGTPRSVPELGELRQLQAALEERIAALKERDTDLK